MQVRILPGVLCPKRKWAMRRDVTPEEAGSSPAGHPAVRRTHVEYGVHPRLWPKLGEAPGLGPGGSGFESLEPHERTDTEIADLPTAGRAHWRGGGTR